jgi:hypothetical protein
MEVLAEHTAADEVMVTTNVYDHAERLRSYERLAEVFDIATLVSSENPRRHHELSQVSLSPLPSLSSRTSDLRHWAPDERTRTADLPHYE